LFPLLEQSLQREQLQLQGIQFPTITRDEGASIELLGFERTNFGKDLEKWIVENHYTSERQWGFISQVNSKEEILLLSLSFHKVIRTRLNVSRGHLTKQLEELTEPEISEIHFRKDGLMEIYSAGSKMRSTLLSSLNESLAGMDPVRTLAIEKESMLSLMKDASEVTSISLAGLGNPFFSDAILSGADPSNSRTFKELISGGTIRSFRARYFSEGESASEEHSSNRELLLVSVRNDCKLRFYTGRKNVLVQSEIEDFLSKLKKFVTSS
jgi:hypothetical protein